MAEAEPTVFIVDDEEPMRDSLATLLESVGLRTQTFASAQEFLDTYTDDQPGCVLLDVRMPGMSGLELQHRLAEQQARLPVIMITGHGDVQMAVRAMKSGAMDFIEKPFNNQVLLDRVHHCLEQDAQERAARAAQDEVRARMEQLSQRETEVMDGMIAGKASKVIAMDLGISPKTVDVHRSNVMRKMGVKSVGQLIRLVVAANGEADTPPPID